MSGRDQPVEDWPTGMELPDHRRRIVAARTARAYYKQQHVKQLAKILKALAEADEVQISPNLSKDLDVR